MIAIWRWVGPTVLLAGMLGAFMALDKTTLHWYVPESNGATVRSAEVTPAPTAAVTITATAIPRFAPFEVQALALQYAAQYFQSPGGWDCGTPELNEARSRWTTVCTTRDVDFPDPVIVVAVDALTGSAADLTSAAQYADNTATATANTATATAAKAATAAANTATAVASAATATAVKTP